eukprot:g38642.t1
MSLESVFGPSGSDMLAGMVSVQQLQHQQCGSGLLVATAVLRVGSPGCGMPAALTLVGGGQDTGCCGGGAQSGVFQLRQTWWC